MGTIIKAGTTLTLRIEPRVTSTDYPDSDENHLVSANLPIPIQVQWSGTGVTGTYKPQAEGDVVNVILEVFMGNKFGVNQGLSANYDMLKIAEVSKSRDLPFVFQDTGKFASQTADRQFFSFDIQSICADLLSYTLAPIKQGTIQSFGGGFGGYNGDISSYLQGNAQPYMNSLGAFRFIDFRVKAEVFDANGDLTVATVSAGSSTVDYIEGLTFCIINAVPQWTDIHRLNKYSISGAASSTTQKFLSYCPNAVGSGTPSYRKPVRLSHQAEWLHFFILEGRATGGSNVTTNIRIKITTSDSNTANLTDFKNLITDEDGTSIVTTGTSATYKAYCIQNVSVTHINSVVPNTITDSTVWYKAQLEIDTSSAGSYEITEERHFVIDRQPAKPAYDFVRFHWLNRLGGIDSYTCTRDVAESISVSKNTYEQRTNQRMFIEEDITPPNYGNNLTSNTNKVDTNFSNTYQESVRVLNVDATKNDSVYTEPMNKIEADWLSELITSPSVWIELENDASQRAYNIDSSMHPSTKDYFPVIITNSSVETVNQEQGLVKFNIEYTHSHKINTQRN